MPIAQYFRRESGPVPAAGCARLRRSRKWSPQPSHRCDGAPARAAALKGACDNKTQQWSTNQLVFSITAGTGYFIWASYGPYDGPVVSNSDLTIP